MVVHGMLNWTGYRKQTRVETPRNPIKCARTKSWSRYRHVIVNLPGGPLYIVLIQSGRHIFLFNRLIALAVAVSPSRKQRTFSDH